MAYATAQVKDQPQDKTEEQLKFLSRTNNVGFFSVLLSLAKEREKHTVCVHLQAKLSDQRASKSRCLNAPLKLHVNKQEGNPATIKLLLAVFNLWISTLSFIEQEDCYWEKELQ